MREAGYHNPSHASIVTGKLRRMSYPSDVELSPLPGKHTGDNFSKLVGLMQRLLAPDGCPWDREQTLTSLLPYVVEETYEVVDAVESGNVDDHREELGDLLLQVVFQSELRAVEGAFGINQVVDGIVEKMVRRHPHVFGDAIAKDAKEVLSNWSDIKAKEKAEKGKTSTLDGVPKTAPALLRATRLGDKAGAVGFDWEGTEGPRNKINEELGELDAAIATGDQAAMEHELGDLLFSVVNLARKLNLDAERALRGSADRFTKRFNYIEESLAAQGTRVKDCQPASLERLWQEAKRTLAK